LPILAIVVAAGCSDSTSDDGSAQPERDASVEGAADASVDVSSDAAFDSQQNDSQPGDSQAADAESGAEDAADGATVTCEALPDGSCSPAPDPTLPPCNGCYGVSASRYNADANCLYDATPETLICTTVCVGYGVSQCYQRTVDGSVEVLLLGSYFDDPQFEQETGLAKCDDALNQEVGSAPPCD